MKKKLQFIVLPAFLILFPLSLCAQYMTIIESKIPCTEIHKAVKAGDLAKVKKMVDAGADLKKTCHQITLLQEAARAGQLPIVKYLVSKGMNPNEKGYPGTIAPPLYLAAGGGYKDIVSFLLAKKAKTDSERTPLIFFAVGSGDQGIVDLLLKKGIKIDAKDALGRNVLHSIASVDKRRNDDPKQAAQLKKMVVYVISKGLDPNATNRVGQTPLQTCGSLSNLGLVVPAKDYQIYKKKRLAVAEALISKGADVNKPTMRRGKPKANTSPLAIAVYSNFDELIDLLLKNKAKTTFSSGMTALHYAVYCGRWEATIKKLLAAGIDINALDKKGQTALFYIVRGGALSDPQKKVFELLLAKKINLNIADKKYGNTVLHNAAKGYNVNVVKKLVENGASLNIKNKKGQTPLDLAKNKKVNAFLVSKGAKSGK